MQLNVTCFGRKVVGNMDEELLLEPFGVAVKVAHCGSQVRVPHLLLDGKDSGSRVHQVRRQRVTKKVRVDTLADTSTTRRSMGNRRYNEDESDPGPIAAGDHAGRGKLD